MPQIVIIDDNRSAGALLRKALERELYHVHLVDHWRRLASQHGQRKVDLVLIRQTRNQDSAWCQFNDFKRDNRHIPAMIYVLPDYQPASMEWIVKAVREVLSPPANPAIRPRHKFNARLPRKSV